jgi:hypothetical protein
MAPEAQTPYTFRPPPRTAQSRRVPPVLFFFVTLVAVGLVGLLAAAVTWQFHPSKKPPCVQNCPPPKAEDRISAVSGEGLAEERTFTASGLGFKVDYPSAWSIQDSGANGVVFSTRHGYLWFSGGKTNLTFTQLILNEINRFSGPRLPDIKPVGPIHGAHIGSSEGQGAMYSATLLPQSGGGTGVLVRIGIIAARKAGVTVLTTGLLPYDGSNDFIVGGGEVDYALTEFRWPGE